ncbi:ABC transporter permease [Rhodoferax sp.]|uniref:MlaE family ABC transporter permease n=1 Tax=Rhodoferax sp. TaxID=50421 RepID=UPI00283F838B|nr:ABC transporter permease [Rhodoferax sp.]MDR3368530.1 ABC transporter permease [Rhodoferax sp.]
MPRSNRRPKPDEHVLWQKSEAGGVLQLRRDWRGYAPGPTQAAPADLARGVVSLDVTELSDWDANLAASLWALLSPLAQRGLALDLSALPDAVRAPLHLAAQAQSQPSRAASLVQPHDHLPSLIRQSLSWHELRTTIAFVGELLLSIGRLHQRPRVFRLTDLWHQMDEMGPRSLPIVALTTFLVGLMLAYMGGTQLSRLGAADLIADVVTIGMVRELAALMTGVILAGRIGGAIAAEIGTMTVNEEIDALRALGIDPLVYLALPRLFGMLLISPLLMAFAMLVGVLAGLPAVTLVYGVSAPDYLQRALLALNWTDLWIGLFKGTMYAALVVIAGCREGFYAGHNAQAIGLATTRAVVKALVWMVTAACASTVVFQRLGF